MKRRTDSIDRNRCTLCDHSLGVHKDGICQVCASKKMHGEAGEHACAPRLEDTMAHPVDADLEWVKRGNLIAAVAERLEREYPGEKAEIDRQSSADFSTVKIASKTVTFDEPMMAGQLSGKLIYFDATAETMLTESRLLELKETGSLWLP